MQALFKDAVQTCLLAGRQTLLQAIVLAFSLMVIIVTGLFVQHELSFDTSQPDYQRSYRINIDFPNIDYGGTAIAVSPGALRDVFSSSRFKNHVSVHSQISAMPANYKLYTADKSLLNVELLAIDNHFSDIFSVKSTTGSTVDSPAQPNGLYISEQTAKKVWNSTDVTGKVLYLNKKHPLVIEGVVAEQQQSSHLSFDALFNKAMIERLDPEYFQHFQMNNFYNYLKVEQDADISNIERQLSKELSERNKKEVVVSLQPISDIYLSTGILMELGDSGSINVLLALVIIAVVVLVIAVSNASSIQAAIVNDRWQEIAIRRLCGAGLWPLIMNFLLSVVITCLFAGFAALVLSELFLPMLSSWLNKRLLMPYSISSIMLLMLLAVVIAGVCAIYPAWLLKTFTVKSVFADKQRASFRSQGLKKIVVTVQLTMTCVLLALCLSLNHYINQMQEIDLGYESENTYLFDASAAGKDVDLVAFMNARTGSSDLEAVAEGEVFPTYNFNIGAEQLRTIDHSSKPIDWAPLVGVSEQYFDLLNINIVSGRAFSETRQGDQLRYDEGNENYRAAVIINEAMRKALGWSNNQEALNQMLVWGPDGIYNGRVIGVSQNVFYSKPTESADPMMFILGRNQTQENYLAMAFSQPLTTDQFQVLERDINQGLGFKGVALVSLQERYQALFKDETIQFRWILIISFILLVSSLAGVFGLIALDTDTRRKELAIRRVLGASAGRLCLFFWYSYSGMFVWMLGASAFGYWAIIALLSYYELLTLPLSLLSFSFAYLVVFIFVSLVIIGRTHWAMKDKPNKILRSH
ncbi:ABC transporter permease [Idiomarina sp. HP20-50]|uniref:ABC transporter permease n=1 Tax=Idiomarina sp. HP20-50 TaxID=3070813 RepID=UPI00294B889A|nr:FtsX-like permease family protein [Idiomarina sp. HP20-50]MDV6316447.1 ABC transporter permease [Idiomarina sp. HP20-50]